MAKLMEFKTGIGQTENKYWRRRA